MRKTDKKTDNQLRKVLTEVCEVALKEIDGFQWLTHLVDYSNFPNSLKIVCVFDTNDDLAKFQSGDSKKELTQLVQTKLNQISINLKKLSEHIAYDTEENCERDHRGNWAKRLG